MPPAAADSVFNRSAYSVRPLWHFIFTVGTQFGFATTPDESWAMRNFLFGIGYGQEAKMEGIASAYTDAFGQPLNIEQAASWVQEIIVSMVSIIHLLIMLTISQRESQQQIESSSMVTPHTTGLAHIE
jgi:hypothetical protein